jgi:hypothetical protein
MSRKVYESEPLRTNDLDLSSRTERLRIRKALFERARKSVDPDQTGFDAVMVTDDSDFFPTDEGDYLDLIDPVINVLFDGAVRLGIAVIAAGVAIAASQMFGSPAGTAYAVPTLLVSGGFAVWFVVSAVAGANRRK